MNNTMKLEQQVVSLELAKQLEELDIEQDSLFYWCSYTHFVEGEMVTDWMLESKESMKVKGLDVGLTYSAFTVAELGEMLPLHIMLGKLKLTMAKSHNYNGDFYSVGYFPLKDRDSLDINLQHDSAIFFERNEADARAKMLIWLIEEGYITQ